MRGSGSATTAAIVLAISFGLVRCEDDCILDAPSLAKLKEGDQCRAAWADIQTVLRPTQTSVGYAWVQRIVEHDMQSAGDTQDEMDGKIIPVVLAQFSNKMYILDHHHHLAALDYVAHRDVKVTVRVVCNLDAATIPDADELFAFLASSKFAYLYGRPRGSPNALPTPVSATSAAFPVEIVFNATYATLADDHWRALASFSRKIKSKEACEKGNKFCARCFDRVCAPSGRAIPFFEYRWAYLFNDAYLHRDLFDAPSDAAAFAEAYDALPRAAPGAADIDDWEDAAKLLLPLCRGVSAGAYAVPSSMGGFAGALPGYHAGGSPIGEEDPDCDFPVCGSS